MPLEPRDLEQLRSAGIPPGEAERQLALLLGHPPHMRLARACRVGDGIARLAANDEAALVHRCRRAAAAGELRVFVPASGAASRMFESLSRSLEESCLLDDLRGRAGAGDRAAAETLRFVQHWQELALADELAAAMQGEPAVASGDARPLLRRLLHESGLQYADRPKALIPFHRGPGGPATALEEHLAEAAAYARDREGRCRVHFTLAPEHRTRVDALLAARLPALEARLATRFELSFSHQSRSTDTVAVDLTGKPFRLASGELLLRPGGHGALLANLQALADGGADVVFIKNIDNVVPERSRELTVHWQQVLGGRLLGLRDAIFAHLARLDESEIDRENAAAAVDFAEAELGFRPTAAWRAASLEERRRSLVARFDRPLRVCAVVRNEGQPGGGPFWVEDPTGEERPQIVESAEVDHDSESQAEVWASSTHFNPVDIVCSMRDRHGDPYELARYRDPNAVFIAAKSSGGRRLLALEHPGLWNGAMARWNTVFVEAPAATFAPVKTILDLLRPEHRS